MSVGKSRGHADGVKKSSKVQATPPHLATTKTKDLPGYLPKATPLEVEALSKKRKGPRGASIVAEVPTGKPFSGLVHLPTGETLAICDNEGVYEIRPGDKPRLLHEVRDGEGIAVDPSGKHLYVAEERKYRVRFLEVTHGKKKGRVKVIDRDMTRALTRPKGVANTGWEGVKFLSRQLLGTKRDYLVLVHEAVPRLIGLFTLPGLEAGPTFNLPKKAKKRAKDVADVEFDPVTRQFVIVSDVSRSVVWLEPVSEQKAAPKAMLASDRLGAVASIQLPLKRSQKPEGLQFDALGRLWVVLDDENDHAKGGSALVLELEY